MGKDPSVFNTLHHFALNDRIHQWEMGIASAWKIIVAQIQQLLEMRVAGGWREREREVRKLGGSWRKKRGMQFVSSSVFHDQ